VDNNNLIVRERFVWQWREAQEQQQPAGTAAAEAAQQRQKTAAAAATAALEASPLKPGHSDKRA